MDKSFFKTEQEFWLREITEYSVPFWLKYARDEKNGGYYCGLRRDGSVYDKHKTSSWVLGRNVWAFGYLYNNLRQDAEWLSYMKHGLDFMKKYSLDDEGHTWGALTSGGKPLAKATDVYHDLYTAQAFCQAAKALGEWDLLDIAKRLIHSVTEITFNPRINPFRPYMATTIPWSSHAEHLILLETLQYLREIQPDAMVDELANQCVKNIIDLHYREDLKVVLEIKSLEDELEPWLSGWAAPGHMMELAWMLIYEGQYRQDQSLIDKGLETCRWAWKWGWDEQRGGLRNDVNIYGEYCIAGHTGHLAVHGPLKMWWSICEALHSNLLAYCITHDEVFCTRYETAKNFAVQNFADREYGEWYGVLSPEGKLLDEGVKGTDIKMNQHTLRSFYFCYRNATQLLE